MNQTFQHLSKILFTFWTMILPVYGAIENYCTSDYKGHVTCQNLEHLKVYTNDPRFVPFCSDASKGCFIRRQLDKLPETHLLRKQLDTKLATHLDFNLALCEVAILTFEPKVYQDEFER